ncbi:MAG: hypothetical protein NXI24_16905 [bacterium]|nr:hypothetical protein [bacterium]
MEGALSGALVFFGLCLVAAATILISVRLYQERPQFVLKVLKYALIGVFFVGFSGASLVIGLRIDDRHASTYSRSLKAVQQIWGGSIRQFPPDFTYDESQRQEYTNEKTGKVETRNITVARNVGIESQDLKVQVASNIRQKGLLKFAGYGLEFDGEYIVRNRENSARDFDFSFQLPEYAGNITGIKITLDERPYTADTNLADGFQWSGVLRPGEERRFRIQYQAKGTDRFDYLLGANQLEVGRLHFDLTTDFTDYRIPEEAMGPTEQAADDQGAKLIWKSENLVTGQNIALRFEIPGNYGKIASKLFFYAPLALLLFTGFLLIAGAAKGVRLHPMHFLFLMTAFFVFYLFGSYIISFVHILLGIGLALALSTGIMLYYAHLIRKGEEFFQSVAFGAAMFQWIFSIAFFFPAYTGLMITLAAIIALVALMRATASIEWEDKW